MKQLQWKNLLSKQRLYSKNYVQNEKYDVKSEYQRDIDRIIFSSAFRRLQDKTQVMPIPGSDFIHTRLTHSLEVASIGRSLGKLVGNFILRHSTEKNIENYTPDNFGNIVAAACLAHDIGNPPFGHTGEKAISKAFEKIFNDNTAIRDELNEIQINDFKKFEGNAAGFRILTNDHPSQLLGGLKLTYATLGAFSKYPSSSMKPELNELGKSVDRKSISKYGFFYEEREIFQIVAEKLKLISLSNEKNNKIWCRHPLSFLVEAADTFTYKIIDLEDAHKIGLISFTDAKNCFYKIIQHSKDPRCNKDDWKQIKDKDEQIGALRSKALNALIHEAYIVFKEHYKEIMSGKFDQEIPDVIKSNKILKSITQITKKDFFRHSLVIDTELVGFEVLGGLISMYVEAIQNIHDAQSERLLLKMPEQHRQILISSETSMYKKLLTISDFVSRMTDSYAIDLYRKIKGIEISNY